MKDLQESDLSSTGMIICLKADLSYDPPKWMAQGLQETASGYGKRLNSGYKIKWMGKVYRIYVTIFSNAGTCWFKVKDRRIVVSAH